jgi:hypothetical protein
MSAGPPLPAQESVDSTALPTLSQLSEAAALALFDEHGQKFHFGHLIHLPTSESLSTLGDDSRVPDVPTNVPGENKTSEVGRGKVAVVFVRHFICGVCQAYVHNLSMVPPEALQKAGASVVIVGCGEWEVLQTYRGVCIAMSFCRRLAGGMTTISAYRDYRVQRTDVR